MTEEEYVAEELAQRERLVQAVGQVLNGQPLVRAVGALGPLLLTSLRELAQAPTPAEEAYLQTVLMHLLDGVKEIAAERMTAMGSPN